MTTPRQWKFVNSIKEAFLLPINRIFIAFWSLGALAIGIYFLIRGKLFETSFWYVLITYALVGLGLEQLLLYRITSLKRFREYLERKYKQDPLTHQLEVLRLIKDLPAQLLERYRQFYQKKMKIMEFIRKHEQDGEGDLNKVQEIERYYVTLLALLAKTYDRKQNFIEGSLEEKRIQDEIRVIKARLSKETHPKLRAVLQQRLQLLEQRRGTSSEIVVQKETIELQLKNLEDTLQFMIDTTLMQQDAYELTMKLSQLTRELSVDFESQIEIQRYLYGEVLSQENPK